MKKINYLLPILLIFLIITLLSSLTLAEEYYVDETVEIMDNGNAVVKGVVNYELVSDIVLDGDKIDGITSELTSKSGKFWLFEYKSDVVFSNSIIKINFPANAKINHINSDSKLIIENDGKTVLSFIGSDSVLDITVQYSFEGESVYNYDYWFYGVAVFVVILILFIVFFKKKDKVKKKRILLNNEKLDAIKLTLNETQLKIVDALLDQNGECSQTKIRHLTGIPKASLSRNLELLAQKNIVSKFYNGTSNYIKVHVQLYG